MLQWDQVDTHRKDRSMAAILGVLVVLIIFALVVFYTLPALGIVLY